MENWRRPSNLPVRNGGCHSGNRRGAVSPPHGGDAGLKTGAPFPPRYTPSPVIRVPVLRWGKPYNSLQTTTVSHFLTGEPVGEVDQAAAGMVKRDLRRASRARAALREIPIRELLDRIREAARLYMEAELPLGNGVQAPEEFVHAQSATTGLPESMCRANMEKNRFVLERMDQVLDALTRGLDLDILSSGHGMEERGVPVSYQAQTPVLACVLPSNSPGVHTLWLPVIPLQVGLVLKPGPEEPWTPYRMAEAFFAAGIPREAIAVYPGGAEVGAAVVEASPRTLIFGSRATVERYRSDPSVRVHGPGFSKILLGDDVVDRWEEHLEVLFESVFLNSGRSCISCSGIWASRHTEAIAEALAERLASFRPRPPDDPESTLAAFTVPGMAEAIDRDIEERLAGGGATDLTAPLRDSPRLAQEGRASWLLPTVLHCESPEAPAANVEYMFPFVAVVRCPQEEMIGRIGDTLVATAITDDANFRTDLLETTSIDRLNFGPIPTTRLNWLQPHEGNILDVLYRARAFQSA